MEVVLTGCEDESRKDEENPERKSKFLYRVQSGRHTQIRNNSGWFESHTVLDCINGDFDLVLVLFP